MGRNQIKSNTNKSALVRDWWPHTLLELTRSSEVKENEYSALGDVWKIILTFINNFGLIGQAGKQYNSPTRSKPTLKLSGLPTQFGESPSHFPNLPQVSVVICLLVMLSWYPSTQRKCACFRYTRPSTWLPNLPLASSGSPQNIAEISMQLESTTHPHTSPIVRLNSELN